MNIYERIMSYYNEIAPWLVSLVKSSAQTIQMALSNNNITNPAKGSINFRPVSGVSYSTNPLFGERDSAIVYR